MAFDFDFNYSVAEFPPNTSIGSICFNHGDLVIGPNSNVFACDDNRGTLNFGERTTIEYICNNSSVISIGDNSRITVILANEGNIKFGKHCTVDYINDNSGIISAGPNSTIIYGDNNHHGIITMEHSISDSYEPSTTEFSKQSSPQTSEADSCEVFHSTSNANCCHPPPPQLFQDSADSMKDQTSAELGYHDPNLPSSWMNGVFSPKSQHGNPDNNFRFSEQNNSGGGMNPNPMDFNFVNREQNIQPSPSFAFGQPTNSTSLFGQSNIGRVNGGSQTNTTSPNNTNGQTQHVRQAQSACVANEGFVPNSNWPGPISSPPTFNPANVQHTIHPSSSQFQAHTNSLPSCNPRTWNWNQLTRNGSNTNNQNENIGISYTIHPSSSQFQAHTNSLPSCNPRTWSWDQLTPNGSNANTQNENSLNSTGQFSNFTFGSGINQGPFNLPTSTPSQTSSSRLWSTQSSPSLGQVTESNAFSLPATPSPILSPPGNFNNNSNFSFFRPNNSSNQRPLSFGFSPTDSTTNQPTQSRIFSPTVVQSEFSPATPGPSTQNIIRRSSLNVGEDSSVFGSDIRPHFGNDLLPSSALARLSMSEYGVNRNNRGPFWHSRIDGLKPHWTESTPIPPPDQRDCPICMDNPRNVTFSCGHVCCEACSLSIRLCHICRKPITQRIKLFL